MLGLWAQENPDRSPVTNTYALKDVRIVQKPGQMIEVGNVIIKDGLIEAVGKDVVIPLNAMVLEADSMYVYPGFIDGMSYIGVTKPEKKEESEGRPRRDKNSANPTYERAGIQPEIQLRDRLSASDKSIADMRKLGFTAAHVVPRGKMLPGQGALILLNGKKADDLIVKEKVSLFSQFVGGGGVYPSTKIAVMAKFRELYIQAEQAKNHQEKYAKSQIGLQRPNYDRVLGAFFPVIDKKLPIYFLADNVKSLHQVYNLQKELGFPLVLANVKQGWYLVDKIKSEQTKVLLSLDLPEAKEGKVKKEEEDKELIAFKKRQEKSLKMHRSQAAVFAEKGIEFSFSSVDTKPKDIRKNLQTMIENGLLEEKALAALTTVPAKQLGVSNSMGTIEKGKMANLVVSDKPYFEEKSNVRFVLVDGEVFEYEIKKKKKGDPNAKVEIAGRWDYKILVPGMEITGTLNLENNDGEVTGTMEMNMDEGEQSIRNATLDGNEFSFEATAEPGGAPMTVSFNLTIDGDSMEGTVDVGEFGTFDFEGERVPE